ncbi:hypothetical protein GCM10027566_23660 [Arachidicoccus ginsenosidivorans]|jgi:hypothetical protein|uniref:Uncharacterized protein n=1 Tax=Arachidicoccus ginsenosidivorans TaxID=496057 RepID=A0A5B8VM30_9BACT|nr:hypothetical protein [Arachidicoccus ginsenosidivorans]QEC71298.1 hypothetical protein FSB73_06005 [Arachidicoccus ginsenosidivorans]
MSNHTGSYMLNEVIKSLKEIGIFNKLTRTDSRALLKAVFGVGYQYDCNPGEILEDIAEEFDVCYSCLTFDVPLRDGICQKCGRWESA